MPEAWWVKAGVSTAFGLESEGGIRQKRDKGLAHVFALWDLYSTALAQRLVTLVMESAKIMYRSRS